MASTAPYGTWSHPISAADPVAGVVRWSGGNRFLGAAVSGRSHRKDPTMKVNSRPWAKALAGLLLAAGLGACAEAESADPTTTPPSTEAQGEQPIADGEHFGLVTVGQDESGEITLGIDLAEMLTGEEARQAAVEEGFIEADEELDTDFYISNPEQVMELVHVAPDAEITVISGSDTSQQVAIDPETLEALYEGAYTGDPVYGIVAGQPIAMDLVIEGGLVSEAHAIYLP